MIFDGKNPNYKEVAERNEGINRYRHTNSKIPICGHDFWDTARTMDYGDVVLCQRCQVYYAKIKNMPWVVKPSKDFHWRGSRLVSLVFGTFHTNHLGDAANLNRKGDYFMTPVQARVTD